MGSMKNLPEEAKETRKQFVKALKENGFDSWDSNSRVSVEDFLIIFDQLVDTIESLDILVSIPSVGLFTLNKLNTKK